MNADEIPRSRSHTYDVKLKWVWIWFKRCCSRESFSMVGFLWVLLYCCRGFMRKVSGRFGVKREKQKIKKRKRIGSSCETGRATRVNWLGWRNLPRKRRIVWYCFKTPSVSGQDRQMPHNPHSSQKFLSSQTNYNY